jgi:hypothetical protein
MKIKVEKSKSVKKQEITKKAKLAVKSTIKAGPGIYPKRP